MLATTGFPVVTRFEGEDLDALVGETGFVCQQTCWFNGLLPIRFLSAVRRSDVSDSDSRPSTEPEEMK